jgi:dihydroorotase
MRLIIKNGRVIDPAQNIDEKIDILVEDGKIKKIDKNIKDENAEIIDAKKLFVFPGLIDMHTHLREPGYEYKEDIESGTKAAAAGGITSIACMANTNPINDNEGVTSYIIEKAKKNGIVNVFPIGAVSKQLKGQELVEMGYISDAGAVGFSDDGYPVRSSIVMRRAFEYQKIIGKIIIEHAEELELSGDGVANESPLSYKLGLRGIPDASESSIIARDIEILRQVGGKLHIAHVSSKWSLELIEKAKRDGLNITAEVTPHHLLLTEEFVSNYSPNFKMKPPLRTEEDRVALVDGIKRGVIDVIASDHAPHTEDEKELEFNFAPFGVVGLETMVGLIFDKLVMSGIINLKRFAEVLSLNPAKILGLDSKGSLEVGKDADITIIDPEMKMKIDPEKFKSKAKNTPFKDWEVKGVPVFTIVSGKIVYKR